ncbi:hypothetical protein LV164_007427 [Aspergillus fumigatus]|nr:hypothetical protein KXX42_000811 [Aspergillus fumigatus]KAH1546316.1 hypothetical protein KXX57_003792 [Aspergillus fumigatus]KAH1980479.1 hypothetical protein KXW88_006692 [Aspergillus fumigatus]KAH2302585.1 hypothetical protein KXV47_001010 [Aspergillus fumigatus]KAH2654995.1 hypothetical protein KXV32_002764 [Aspergillus fumigatus]
MAIHPTLPSQANSQGRLTPQQTRAISAWSEQAAASLRNLTLSESVSASDRNVEFISTRDSPLRGSSVPLSIPLDDPAPVVHTGAVPRVKLVTRESETQPVASVSFRRREPIRRDSLKRREALLKGKDGSRRRQRWENDRLLHNPWVEPPAPSDWAVQPTYPRHDPMPYYLAPLWDMKYAHLDRTSSRQTQKGTRHEKHRVPKELRMRLKHARAARGMLQDLEEDIRQFIQTWSEKQLMLRKEGLEDAPLSSEDESEDEVVFVGRNGQMHDSPEHKTRLRELRANLSQHNERDGEKMVFESPVDDRAAGFGRWLVHSIASYYGLHTWSITVGEPARREAYVGFHMPAPGSRPGLTTHVSVPSNAQQGAMMKPGDDLPKPLWAQI